MTACPHRVEISAPAGPGLVTVAVGAPPAVVELLVPGPAGPPGPGYAGFGTIDYSDLDAVALDADGAIVAGTPLLMAAGQWTRVTRSAAASASNVNLPSGPFAGFPFWDGAILRARAVGDGYLIKFSFRVRPSQRDGAVRFAVRPGGDPAFDFGPDATVLTVDGGQVETGSRTFYQQARARFVTMGAEIWVHSTGGGELLAFSPEIVPLLYKP